MRNKDLAYSEYQVENFSISTKKNPDLLLTVLRFGKIYVLIN